MMYRYILPVFIISLLFSSCVSTEGEPDTVQEIEAEPAPVVIIVEDDPAITPQIAEPPAATTSQLPVCPSWTRGKVPVSHPGTSERNLAPLSNTL